VADQFSYPVVFREPPSRLKEYSQEILELVCIDTVQLTYFLDNNWVKAAAGTMFPETSLENVIYRSVIQEGHFMEIPDVLNHQSYKFIALKSGLPLIRYIAAVPIFSGCKIVTGAITLIDRRRLAMKDHQIQLLESFAKKIGEDPNISMSNTFSSFS
jgi:hypothetical protein